MTGFYVRFPGGRRIVALAAVLFLVGASFLPGELKRQFHMRGPLHAWGHVYAFVLVLLAWQPSFSRVSQQWRAAGSLVLLGFAIEFLQARQSWAAVEWADLVCDTSGVLTGLLILTLGAARAGNRSGLTSADRPLA